MRAGLITGFWCVLLQVAAAPAAVHYVDHQASGGNNGTSWQDAFTSLQAALAVAQAGDQVWVATGVYRPAGQGGSRDDTFALRSGVQVYGGFAGTETELGQRDWRTHVTTLSGDLNNDDTPNFGNRNDNSYHVVTASGTDAGAALDGFTVRSGQANGAVERNSGAGLCNDGGRAVIAHCTFTDNYASWLGGGAHNTAAGSTYVDCTFLANRVERGGGGLAATTGSDLALTDCLFDQNVGGAGAGCYNDHQSRVRAQRSTFARNIGLVGTAPGPGAFVVDGEAAFLECTFVANETQAGGGGICSLNSTAQAVSCTFFGNRGLFDGGGGIFVQAGNMTLINCLLSGNLTRCSGGSGMVTSFEADVRAINCVFAYNEDDSPCQAAGIWQAGRLLELTNCILWGNIDPNGPESTQLRVIEGTAVVNHTCIQRWTGQFGGVGNFGNDPSFADFDGADDIVGTPDDNLRLRPGSPGIDAGDSGALPADRWDLDGDGNRTELLPLDLDRRARRHDDPNTPDTGTGPPPIVDFGPYEFGAPARVPGDLNCDGVVNFADINPFVLAIGDPDEYRRQFPNCNILNGDCNNDGQVNFGDINPFVELLSG